MRKLLVVLISLLLLTSYAYSRVSQVEVTASNGYPVHNLDTGLNYTTIQEAIDANDTLDEHTIFIENGEYYEDITVYKSLTLFGEERKRTILNGNSSDVVRIINDNVTITGFTLSSSNYGAAGVYVRGSYNNISHNTIRQNWYGVVLSLATNNLVTSNDIILSEEDGVLIVSSSNNIINGNNISNNWNGISLYESMGNTVSRNTITDNSDTGLSFTFSTGNILRNNSISGNPYNFGVYGSDLSEYTNDVDESNVINEKPITYWIHQENLTVPSNSGFVALVNCKNITVTELLLKSNDQGLILAYTTNSMICQNTLMSNLNGMKLFESSNNVIAENNVTRNLSGIRLESSNFNNVSHNSFEYAGGINIVHSEFNIVSGNSFVNNVNPISFWQSSSNKIFHNNFHDYSEILSNEQFPNLLDNGIEGNFWSNYNSTDTNNDGIGDTPYIIDENNTDNYPLMGMFYDFIATSEFNIQAICNSTIVDFQTDYYENMIGFNVTGEYGATGFCRICVPTALLNDSIRVFVNGTEVPYRLLPLSNGTHNYLYFIYGVWSFGDLYSDREIDIRDITYAARAFGSYPSHPRWNPLCDFNCDYEVNLLDLTLIASNFGKTYY